MHRESPALRNTRGQEQLPPQQQNAGSPHGGRSTSCLCKSEQSASSLSQSEGIQSAAAAEYQAGRRRVSSLD
ncbi:Hypothetical protein SMAX5B_003952 [Scophthalmus maximus]|uniref:Uncharacterized protein n=1 Tax=Scophthalmus maximus TaxID=52904 RepID=A0A2U9AVD7_SCOMX|nr:Hypothetical protein SMAX5B_003952 [Scophthalmus maximus]KAF0046231.1 hypothetical protein F2P81_002760 [Scophthalmus maximus]